MTGLFFFAPVLFAAASLMAQQERILLPMQEIQFLSLEQKDLLEKEMITHFNKEIPRTEELAGTVHGITELNMTLWLNSNNTLFAAADHFHTYLTCSGWVDTGLPS